MPDTTSVRLATVPTPKDSGLLASLLPTFERETATSVSVYAGEDALDQARAGRADLVVAHYGHDSMEQFITDGFGRWPCPVFANQQALIGPAEDAAGVRGFVDAVEALTTIAKSGAPFVVNGIGGVDYLTRVLTAAAGLTLVGDWVLDGGVKKGQAARLAAERGGYMFWGVTPFLRFCRQNDDRRLVPLVTADPILQRTMVSVVVNPDRVDGVDDQAARALQAFLLDPETQASIRKFRTDDYDAQLWWPAGRENAHDHLPG